MKRTVPMVIAGITGFVVIFAYFIPYTEDWGDKTMIWFDILAGVAFVLGGANILKVNLQKISYRREGWGFAIVTLVGFIVTLIIGFSKFGILPSEKFPDFAWSGDVNTEGGGLWWIYNYMYSPLAATMFSLLACFVASAAFRAFRAKNTEATILLCTAFVVLLGRTYLGALIQLDLVSSYIMNVINLAGIRAVTIGIALGIVSTSLKVLLGVDRSYLGSDKE